MNCGQVKNTWDIKVHRCQNLLSFINKGVESEKLDEDDNGRYDNDRYDYYNDIDEA